MSAPNIPIQFCVGRPAGDVAAVFSDGSSGEYETSARTRRAAKIRTRNPISSLSRRLLVGVNARVRIMLALERATVPRGFLGLIPPASLTQADTTTARAAVRNA